MNRREKKHEKNPKTFTGYSQAITDVYENLEGYNLANKGKVPIVFDDMIADTKLTKY